MYHWTVLVYYIYIYLHVHAIYTSKWYVRNYVRIYMVCHGGDHSKKVIVLFLFFNGQVSRRRRCFGWQRCAQRRWVCRRRRRCHASHADCSGRSRLKAIEAAVASKTWKNELYESLKTKTRQQLPSETAKPASPCLLRCLQINRNPSNPSKCLLHPAIPANQQKSVKPELQHHPPCLSSTLLLGTFASTFHVSAVQCCATLCPDHPPGIKELGGVRHGKPPRLPRPPRALKAPPAPPAPPAHCRLLGLLGMLGERRLLGRPLLRPLETPEKAGMPCGNPWKPCEGSRVIAPHSTQVTHGRSDACFSHTKLVEVRKGEWNAQLLRLSAASIVRTRESERTKRCLECRAIWLPVCLSVFLSICLSVCLSIELSFYVSIWLPVCLSIYLFVSLSICLSICLSVFLSFCLSIYMSICLAVSLCVYESIYLSVCLSFCLMIYPIYLSICLSIYLPSPIYLYICLPRYRFICLSIYSIYSICLFV